MSQRAKKATKQISTSSAQSVTSTGSSVSSMASEGSTETPLSPSRRSRLHEKHSLMNLNDRLACYIDRVRYLEQENSRLQIELAAHQDTSNREVHNLKSIYESELADARKLLDETAREKAKIEIDAKRYWEENDQLRIKLNRKTKELNELEKETRTTEARLVELTSNYNGACTERKKLQEELRELEKETVKLRKNSEAMRNDLEQETLARVDLENNLQSLREELTFKEHVHSQELSESKMRRQTEVSEIDGFLMEQYETKLQQTLQELREQYDMQLRINKEEISDLYDARIQTLESQLATEREHFEAERMKQEKEIARLRDEMTVQLKEYQELMDIKISLDMEIAAYDKLLSSEETRLNITPSISSTTATATALSTSSRLFRTPSMKRKRTALDESTGYDFSINNSAKGDVEIADCDIDGKFVRLYNKSKAASQKLEGWQLIRKLVGPDPPVELAYKFGKSAKLDASKTLSVWSTDAGPSKDDPDTGALVMKGKSWPVGDNFVTIVLNGEGDEVARMEHTKLATLNISGHKDKYFQDEGRARLGVSNIEGKSKNDEQCVVM